MLTLPRKYAGIYKLARKLGCNKLIIREEGSHLSLDITCPSNYVSNRIKEKARELNTNINSSEKALNLKIHFETAAPRSDAAKSGFEG